MSVLHPRLKSIWAIWANLCGVSVLSFAIAYYGLVRPLTQEGPVSVHTDGNLETPVVKEGGFLCFTVRVERKEPCPGSIIDVYERKLENNGRSQVIMPRAIRTTAVAVTPKLPVCVQIPARVTQGKWSFQSDLSSQCPTRTRIDRIIAFDFEVVP